MNRAYKKDPIELRREEIIEKVTEIYISQQHISCSLLFTKRCLVLHKLTLTVIFSLILTEIRLKFGDNGSSINSGCKILEADVKDSISFCSLHHEGSSSSGIL